MGSRNKRRKEKKRNFEEGGKSTGSEEKVCKPGNSLKAREKLDSRLGETPENQKKKNINIKTQKKGFAD